MAVEFYKPDSVLGLHCIFFLPKTCSAKGMVLSVLDSKQHLCIDIQKMKPKLWRLAANVMAVSRNSLPSDTVAFNTHLKE